jgi:hypothetical protein
MVLTNHASKEPIKWTFTSRKFGDRRDVPHFPELRNRGQFRLSPDFPAQAPSRSV